MSHHAVVSSTRRSSSAERAHRAGLVTGTIALPAATFRDRLTVTAARNGGALAIVATTIWIYDVVRIVQGG